MFKRCASVYSVSWAEDAALSVRTTAALANSDRMSDFMRIVLSLEVEIQSEEETVVSQIGKRDRRSTTLFDPRVLGVQSQTSTARHNRIPPATKGISVDITEVGRRTRQCLLRHAHVLVTFKEHELRVQRQVRLDNVAVPGWVASAGRERDIRRSRRPKVRVVGCVLVIERYIKLADVNVGEHACAVERLIAQT